MISLITHLHSLNNATFNPSLNMPWVIDNSPQNLDNQNLHEKTRLLIKGLESYEKKIKSLPLEDFWLNRAIVPTKNIEANKQRYNNIPRNKRQAIRRARYRHNSPLDQKQSINFLTINFSDPHGNVEDQLIDFQSLSSKLFRLERASRKVSEEYLTTFTELMRHFWDKEESAYSRLKLGQHEKMKRIVKEFATNSGKLVAGCKRGKTCRSMYDHLQNSMHYAFLSATFLYTTKEESKDFITSYLNTCKTILNEASISQKASIISMLEDAFSGFLSTDHNINMQNSLKEQLRSFTFQSFKDICKTIYKESFTTRRTYTIALQRIPTTSRTTTPVPTTSTTKTTTPRTTTPVPTTSTTKTTTPRTTTPVPTTTEELATSTIEATTIQEPVTLRTTTQAPTTSTTKTTTPRTTTQAATTTEELTTPRTTTAVPTTTEELVTSTIEDTTIQELVTLKTTTEAPTTSTTKTTTPRTTTPAPTTTEELVTSTIEDTTIQEPVTLRTTTEVPTTSTPKTTTPRITTQAATTTEELTTVDFSEATSNSLIAEDSKDVKKESDNEENVIKKSIFGVLGSLLGIGVGVGAFLTRKKWRRNDRKENIESGVKNDEVEFSLIGNANRDTSDIVGEEYRARITNRKYE